MGEGDISAHRGSVSVWIHATLEEGASSLAVEEIFSAQLDSAIYHHTTTSSVNSYWVRSTLSLFKSADTRVFDICWIWIWSWNRWNRWIWWSVLTTQFLEGNLGKQTVWQTWFLPAWQPFDWNWTVPPLALLRPVEPGISQLCFSFSFQKFARDFLVEKFFLPSAPSSKEFLSF